MEGVNMKHHIKVNRKLLQSNKHFSQLKHRQKDWIATELYKLYHDKMKERRTTRKLPANHRDEVISFLYEKIQQRKIRSEEHTSELQSRFDLVCRLLLEKK